VPRSADGSGSEPPVRTLRVTAVLIGLFCVVALLWGMFVDLRLPAKVAVFTVAFNVLVILVKIAETLVVEPSTVRKHLENIYARLDVRSRSAALARLRDLASRGDAQRLARNG
jgi:hypothetical protein